MSELKPSAGNASMAGVAQPEVIDLRRYLEILLRVKWRILGTALVLTLIAGLVVFSITPIYRATTTVLIESTEAKVLSIEEVYGIDSKAKEYFLTQFEIIKSRPIAERVVGDNDLSQYPGYAPDEAGGFDLLAFLPEGMLGALPATEETADPFMKQVRTYRENLQVAPVRNTQLVDIHFESEDPKLAARLANAHANAYIDSTLEAKLSITQSAAQWMSSRLERLKVNLEESQKRVQEFLEREQLVDSGGAGGVTALPEREVNELTSRLVEARRALTDAKSNYLQVRGINATSLNQLDSVPAVIGDDLVQDRRNEMAMAEKRVAELSKRYGPKHPTMIGAQSDLQAAKDSLGRAVATVVDGIRQEYDLAQSRVRELESAVDTARASFRQTGRKESELFELQRAVDSNRQLYDLFYNRMRETTETGDLATAAARVISPAVPPELPAKPNKKLVVALTFMASLMLGALVAFLADAMDNVIRGARDFDEKLRESLLCVVPLIGQNTGGGKKDRRSSARAFFREEERGLQESVRTLRTSLALSALDDPHKVLMVTSSVPGEGKSTIAANLAFAFGQMGKAILVDCDMRRPSLAKEFGLDKKLPGLADLMAGTAKPGDVIVRRDEEKIHLLTAGTLPPNPLELLSSSRFQMLMEELKTRYDHVVLDCPPALPVSDATLLTTRSDGIVYVVRAGNTTTRQVQQGLKTLREVNGNVVGCVLNAVDTKKAAQYDGEYGYYETYG